MRVGKRRPSASLVAILTAGLLLALFVVHVLALGGIVSSRGWFSRTRQVQTLLSTVRAGLLDAETGERGFLLTNRPDQLDAFQSAARTLPATFAELRSLSEDDPIQRRNAEELEALSTKKIEEMRTTVELHRAGQSQRALAIVRSDDADYLMARMRRLSAEMRAHADARLEERTITARQRINAALWIDVGALVGLLALGLFLFRLHRDITRRETMERALRDEGLFREQFMAMLSHDLRIPLSAVSLASDVLKSEALPASSARWVRRIATSADRMTRMVDELLDLTRARQGGGIPINPRAETDLGEVVNRAVDELRAAHPNAEIALTTDDRVVGPWDTDRLSQVASNLVANAIAHGTGRIVVHVRQASGQALLEVKNGGPPIPEDVVPHMFKAFQRRRTKPSARTDGVGLGLFIAERIVAAHGGHITVRSSATEGTSFTVVLPGAAAESAGSSTGSAPVAG